MHRLRCRTMKCAAGCGLPLVALQTRHATVLPAAGGAAGAAAAAAPPPLAASPVGTAPLPASAALFAVAAATTGWWAACGSRWAAAPSSWPAAGGCCLLASVGFAFATAACDSAICRPTRSHASRLACCGPLLCASSCSGEDDVTPQSVHTDDLPASSWAAAMCFLLCVHGKPRPLAARHGRLKRTLLCAVLPLYRLDIEPGSAPRLTPMPAPLLHYTTTTAAQPRCWVNQNATSEAKCPCPA